jgi:hypothetical protein
MFIQFVEPEDAISSADNCITMGHLSRRAEYKTPVNIYVQLQVPVWNKVLGPLLTLETYADIEYCVGNTRYSIRSLDKQPIPDIDTILDDGMHVSWDSTQDIPTQILSGRCIVQRTQLPS